MKKNKLIAWIVTSVLVAAVLIVAMVTQTPKIEEVASVEGKTITKDQLYDALVESYGPATLDTLINDRIIELEAKKQGITVSDDEIQEELDVLTQQYGSEEVLEAQLAASGLTLDNLKDDIVNYIKTKKLVEPTIEITDEEISAYFEQNKAALGQEEQVEASHILVEDKKTADEVLEKLNNGGDFAELAKEYSSDGSAASGGELGFFGKGKMVAEFEEAAFALKVDEISEPVKSEYGYHIIKVTDKKEAKEATLKDNEETIKETILAQKMQTGFSAWIQEAKANYEVTNELVKTEEE